MTSKSTRMLPLAAALTLSFGVALAQTGGGSAAASGTGSSVTGGRSAPAAQAGAGTRNSETRKDDKLARGDRKFIQEASEGGMFEVEAAKLAESKAGDAGVKSFAHMLVEEHSKANDELVQLANAKKVELPAGPPRSKRKDIEKLAKLGGTQFDQHFMREVGIKDHEKDIKQFEKASGSVKDPQLKAWVDKTLPHLRQHLAQAQKMPQGNEAAAMGNRGAGPGGTGGANGANKTGS